MTSNLKVLETAYYLAVQDGATVSRNRVTLCVIHGIKTRYQVYSDRSGKYYDKFFSDLQDAIDKFMELSR